MTLESRPNQPQNPEGISPQQQEIQEIKKTRSTQGTVKKRLSDMSTVVIETYSETQWQKILQFDNAIKLVNRFEVNMQRFECDALIVKFSSGDEKEVDQKIVHAMKGGIAGQYRELVSEGLKSRADNIIFLNTVKKDINS